MALSFPANQRIFLDSMLNWLLFDPTAPRIELEHELWSHEQVQRFGRSLEAGRRFRIRDYPCCSNGDGSNRPANKPYDIIIRPVQATKRGQSMIKRQYRHHKIYQQIRVAKKRQRILHPAEYLCLARLELILNRSKQTGQKRAVTRVTDLQSEPSWDDSGIPTAKLLPPRPSHLFTPNDEEVMPRGGCPHEKLVYPNDVAKVRMEIDVPAGWKGRKCTQKTMRSWVPLRESKYSPSRVLRLLWQNKVSRRMGRRAGR